MKNEAFMHSDIAPEQSEMNALMSGIVLKAADDLRLAFKHDISNQKFSSSSNPIYNTKSIVSFFASSWGHVCCGKIDPWYIVGHLLEDSAKEYIPKNRQAKRNWYNDIYKEQIKNYYNDVKERR